MQEDSRSKDNRTTGAIGVVLAVAFLAWTALGIGAVPLAIIVFGVLILPIVDYVQSLKKGNNNGQ